MDTQTETPGTLEDAIGQKLVEGAKDRQAAAPEQAGNQPMDQDGAQPLNPSEQGKLDQIAGGLSGGGSKPPTKPGGGTGMSPGGEGSSGGGRFSNAIRGAQSFAGKHKKGMAIGGGGLMLAALPIVIILFLLPYKLASFMANIVSKTAAGVENSVERRGERILFTYLAQKAGVELGSGVVIDKGGMATTLYANWSKNSFEKKLAEKGLVISKGSAPGRVNVFFGETKVLKDGTIVTYGSTGATEEFKNLDEFLNKDLSSSDARRFFREIVAHETHSVRWLHRLHMRRWLRNAAGVRKWFVFDRKTGKAATTEVDTALTDLVGKPTLDNLSRDMGCAIEGDNCPDNSEHRDSPNGTDPDSPIKIADDPKATCDSSAADCTKELSNPENASQTGTVEDSVKGATDASGLKKILEHEITQKILKIGVGIGALDLMASLDNALANNTFGKLIEARRATQYADLYSAWQSMNDQIKDGKTVSADEVNATMSKLKDIQNSSAFSCLYEQDCTKGQPLDPDKKVGSGGGVDGSNSVSYWYMHSIGVVLHPVLSVYRATVGQVVKAISAILQPVIDAIIKVTGLTSLVEFVSEKLGELLNYVLGTVVDGTEVDAPLANGILGGADVTYNGMARDTLGEVAVTNDEAMTIDAQINGEQRAIDRNQPMIARLFSPDVPSSLVNQLAAAAPVSAGDAVNQTGSYIASIMGQPVRFFSNFLLSTIFRPVHAQVGSYVTLSGVQQYRATQAMVDGPLVLPDSDVAGPPGPDGKPTGPDGKIDEYDCPYIADIHTPNQCLLDVAAVETMQASAGMKPGGGLDDATPAAGAGPTAPGSAVTGDARALATQLANNSNMIYTQATTKADLLKYGSGGTVTNACGDPMGVSPYLSGALLSLTQKYKITVDDIGFGDDRDGCETGTYQHPKGNAIDIRSIAIINGASTSSNLHNYPADAVVANQFATDFLALLPHSSYGGVGQKGCGMNPTFPSWATNVNGAALFDDSCDHLHIDVRNRDNLMEAAGAP